MTDVQKSSYFVVTESLTTNELNSGNFTKLNNYLNQTKMVQQNKGRIIAHTESEFPMNERVKPCLDNGFVSTLLHAYNNHLHLKLRPDDVWIAITTAFGLFMNGTNAEELRKHFVKFEGKRKLQVVTSNMNIYSDQDWRPIINRFADLIEENTINETRQWLEPNFSTTSPVSRLVGQAVMMGVLKHYFDYTVYICCGIPCVTLEGTLQDWLNIREKVKKFESFDNNKLKHWSGLLDFVLQKFIESYKGNVDKDFWSKIVSKQSFGSGAPFIQGWANVFLPFNSNGHYILSESNPETLVWTQIRINRIPPSTSECPVKIIDNSGVETDTIFYCGHFMSSYNSEEKSIRPSLDWAVIDVTNEKEKIAANYKPQVFSYEP